MLQQDSTIMGLKLPHVPACSFKFRTFFALDLKWRAGPLITIIKRLLCCQACCHARGIAGGTHWCQINKIPNKSTPDFN